MILCKYGLAFNLTKSPHTYRTKLPVRIMCEYSRICPIQTVNLSIYNANIGHMSYFTTDKEGTLNHA
jgi:hypothetical protein